MRRRVNLLGLLGVVALITAVIGLAMPSKAAGSVTATFSKDSDWGTGYQGKYTITNGTTTTLNGWTVVFTLPSNETLGTYWDALMSQSGTQVTATNRNYNATIAPGASTTFGFLVSYTGATGAPTSCTINGASCNGGGTTTTAPPTTGPPTTGPPTTRPPTTTTRPPTTTSTTVPPGGGGSVHVAPYIDITLGSPTLQAAAQATGQKLYTLAFILGSSAGCDPKWGGTIDLTNSSIISQVQALKAMGGDVVVSSGGAVSPYLESVCSSADTLKAAYEKTLDAVGSHHLDLDIEAAIPADMVSTALAGLQHDRPNVDVSFTLRVQSDDFGVDPFSVQVLQSAVAHGVNVGIVNPMTMDFSSSRPWGDAIIAAAQSTLGQMRQIWPGKTDAQLKAMLGITPMIGRNDTGPVTTQAVANQVVSWAQQNHIGRLAFWSVGRDNGGCPNGGVSPTCSGISQSNFEFTNIFKQFQG